MDAGAADRAVHTVHVHTGAAELVRTATTCRRKFEQPRAVGDTLQDIESVTPELFGDDAYKIFGHRFGAGPSAAPAITPA